jgi:hypothetical protein
MSELQSELFNELLQLCAQYKVEVPGARQAWPESVKALVHNLILEGVSGPEIARRTGISYFTINKWTRNIRKAAAPSFIEAKVVPSVPSGLKSVQKPRGRPKSIATVTVAESKSNLSAPPPSCPVVTVTVTTPSGYKIEGLPVDMALSLAGARGLR